MDAHCFNLTRFCRDSSSIEAFETKTVTRLFAATYDMSTSRSSISTFPYWHRLCMDRLAKGSIRDVALRKGNTAVKLSPWGNSPATDKGCNCVVWFGFLDFVQRASVSYTFLSVGIVYVGVRNCRRFWSPLCARGCWVCKDCRFDCAWYLWRNRIPIPKQDGIEVCMFLPIRLVPLFLRLF